MNELKDFPIGTRVKILGTNKTGEICGHPSFVLESNSLVAVFTDFTNSEIPYCSVTNCVEVSEVEKISGVSVLDFTELKELSERDRKFLESLNSNQLNHLYKMFHEVSDTCWKNGFKEGKNG